MHVLESISVSTVWMPCSQVIRMAASIGARIKMSQRSMFLGVVITGLKNRITLLVDLSL